MVRNSFQFDLLKEKQNFANSSMKKRILQLNIKKINVI